MINLKTFRYLPNFSWFKGLPWTVRHKLPSTWAEVTRRQAIIFARCLIHYNQPFHQWAASFKFNVLNAFTGLKPWHFFTMSDLAIALLLQKTEQFWEGDASYPALRWIRIGWRKYHLPTWCMESSEFLDLALAEEYYLKIQDPEDADAWKNMKVLAGVLCRPKGHKPNQEHTAARLNYSPRSLPGRLWQALAYPEHAEVFAVYFYYYSVRRQLRQMYPEVYKEKSKQAGTGGPDFTSRYNLLGVIHSLAGQGPFGTWKETAAENCHTVLHYLNYNADKMREQELKQKMKSVT